MLPGVEMFIHQWWAMPYCGLKKWKHMAIVLSCIFINPKAKYKVSIPGWQILLFLVQL
jgi:hypothetical protein